MILIKIIVKFIILNQIGRILLLHSNSSYPKMTNLTVFCKNWDKIQKKAKYKW